MTPFVLRVKGGEDTFFSPLENFHSEQDITYVWKITNKVKDALENGSRMENMSWRLWFRHQLINQQKLEEKQKQQLQLLEQQRQFEHSLTLHVQQQQQQEQQNHHHQFWFDQHHNPPPPPTKDLPPDMMDFDDTTNQFMLHNNPTHDFLFGNENHQHSHNLNHHHHHGDTINTIATANIKSIDHHLQEGDTPWPLAATEYDLQRDMRDTPPSFQQDQHLDNALASRMAAFSMQPINSMPSSPILPHMTPMSMHHRTPQDAINGNNNNNNTAGTGAAVYVESSTLLQQQDQSTTTTSLHKLLEQQQQTNHHHHHHHPTARVRSRPQISLEIEGLTSSSSSSANDHSSSLYHTDLFSPSIASSSHQQPGDIMPVPQILNLLEQAGMYDGDQPTKFEQHHQQQQLPQQSLQLHHQHHHPFHNNNHQQVQTQKPTTTSLAKLRKKNIISKTKDDMNQESSYSSSSSEDESSSDDDSSDDDNDDTSSDEEEDEEIDDTPICTNCGATSTPLWRRSPDDELLCNACGLYQKLHNAPRPKSLRPNSARKEIREEAAVRLVCSNCKTTTTPLWRRDGEGAPLCNACGLYLKLHHEKRPLSMKSDTIKKRQRYESQRNRKKKGKKKKDKKTKKKRLRKDDSHSKKNKHREEKRGRVAYSPTPEVASLPSPATMTTAEAEALASSSSILASTTQLMMNFQQATAAQQQQQQPFYQDHLFQHSFNFTPSSPSSSTHNNNNSSNNDLCDGSCIAGMGAADF
ncbi:hypothetical protein INT45_001543 [Circinella minor]|uniref:GATA-type domain-containing protein n=1 Tax=Circinella minor TaxID=1195481 RepID=A0A8H7VEY6_9FUNG|nr:hypothetical protein INT45_001543 [Circinella minor]